MKFFPSPSRVAAQIQIQIDLTATAKGHKQSKWQPRLEHDGSNVNNPHGKWYFKEK